MKINKLIESRDSQTNTAMEFMLDNNSKQLDPMVGIFWYDFYKKELFGVYALFADELNFYHSTIYDADVKTCSRLHKDVWKRNSYKDKRYSGDYTKFPRGRVFEIKDKGFRVYVGDWIDDYPECEEMILDEFQLPEDTEFVKDVHWNLGHGWSDVVA